MKIILLISILFYTINTSDGMTCKTENIFGITKYVTCPRLYDEPNEIYCCESDDDFKCCSDPFGISEEDLENLASKLPAILGAIVAIAITFVIVCVICCCCCPFCLLYKKRSRGNVLRTAGATAGQGTTIQIQQPATTTYAPVQQTPYPNASYPSGYAQQPVAAPYPMSQQKPPYPTSQEPAPYPISGTNERPPPYVEKQQPFNPNY